MDKKLDNVGYRGGPRLRADQALSFYAQQLHRQRPIGSLITLSAGSVPFDLSTAQQWEAGLGACSSTASGEWTLAAYHITKEEAAHPRHPHIRRPAVQVGEQISKGLGGARWRCELGVGLERQRQRHGARRPSSTTSPRTWGASAGRNGNTPADVPEPSRGNLWLSWQVIPQVRGSMAACAMSASSSATTSTPPASVLPSYTRGRTAGLEWRLRANLALNLQVFNAFDKRLRDQQPTGPISASSAARGPSSCG